MKELKTYNIEMTTWLSNGSLSYGFEDLKVIAESKREAVDMCRAKAGELFRTAKVNSTQPAPQDAQKGVYNV